MKTKPKILSPCSSCVYRINYDEMCLTFSLKHLNPSVLNSLDKSDFSALLNQFVSLSNMTWKQIKQSGRHGLGAEKIDISAISESIPKSLSDQDVTFLALRYKGKALMVGFRERDIFYVVWIDRSFSLYAH